MELVVKAAVICIVVALTAVLLQRDTPEMSLLLVLSAIAVVMTFALSFYQDLRQMALLLEETGLDGTLFLPILKIIAISLIAKLGGDVCKDSGQGALASLVDMAGTVCALLAAQPLLHRALEILVDLGR